MCKVTECLLLIDKGVIASSKSHLAPTLERMSKSSDSPPPQSCVYFVSTLCLFSTCSIEQVNNLREVQALRRLNPHPHIIDLKEVIL